jgi:protein-disulfide isomerase
MLNSLILFCLIVLPAHLLADTQELIPIKGDANSEIKVVMYGDYQCPFTQRGNAIIMALLKETQNSFALSIKHFPLSFHDNAYYAAKVAICSGQQDKFWEMHDLIFLLKNSEVSPKNLNKFGNYSGPLKK